MLSADDLGTFSGFLGETLHFGGRRFLRSMLTRHECWEVLSPPSVYLNRELSAPKSQRFLRFAIAMPIADHRNRAISETRESNAALRLKKSLAICDFGLAAISEPKAPSFCGISGDLAPSTRKSLAIAIVRFWCAKIENVCMHLHFVALVVVLHNWVCDNWAYQLPKISPRRQNSPDSPSEGSFPLKDPRHLKPVIIKPVGRICEITLTAQRLNNFRIALRD